MRKLVRVFGLSVALVGSSAHAGEGITLFGDSFNDFKVIDCETPTTQVQQVGKGRDQGIAIAGAAAMVAGGAAGVTHLFLPSDIERRLAKNKRLVQNLEIIANLENIKSDLNARFNDVHHRIHQFMVDNKLTGRLEELRKQIEVRTGTAANPSPAELFEGTSLSHEQRMRFTGLQAERTDIIANQLRVNRQLDHAIRAFTNNSGGMHLTPMRKGEAASLAERANKTKNSYQSRVEMMSSEASRTRMRRHGAGVVGLGIAALGAVVLVNAENIAEMIDGNQGQSLDEAQQKVAEETLRCLANNLDQIEEPMSASGAKK